MISPCSSPSCPRTSRAVACRASAVAPDLQRTRLFEAVVALLGWAAAAGAAAAGARGRPRRRRAEPRAGRLRRPPAGRPAGDDGDHAARAAPRAPTPTVSSTRCARAACWPASSIWRHSNRAAVATLARSAARLERGRHRAGGRARRRQRAARGRDRAGARPRARGRRTEPARLGAGDARAARRPTLVSWSSSRRWRRDRSRPWSSGGCRSQIPRRRRPTRSSPVCCWRPATASRSATRSCATRCTRRSPSPAGADFITGGRSRCLPANARARSRVRPRWPVISALRGPTPKRFQSSSARPARRVRSPRWTRRSDTSARRSRSLLTAPRAGSRSASSRRGGAGARRRRPRSGGRWRCWLETTRSCWRARGCARRAPTTARSASRGPCSRAPARRSS